MQVTDLDVFDYRYDQDSGTVKINVLGSIYGASVEDYSEVMSRVINILQEVPGAESVILSESREYEYSDDQIKLLRGIASAIEDISSQGYLSQNPDNQCASFYSEHLPEVQSIAIDQLRHDPVGAYVELLRMERHLKQKQDESNSRRKRCIKYFFQDVLNPVINRLEDTML
ncbi:MAG: hypothetical protein BRC26_02135, partial [Nanohaloarchaea archaeon QH_8_44_6]